MDWLSRLQQLPLSRRRAVWDLLFEEPADLRNSIQESPEFPELQQLTPAQRLELRGKLFTSDELEAEPFPPEVVEMLDERWRRFQAGEEASYTLDEVKQHFRDQYGCTL